MFWGKKKTNTIEQSKSDYEQAIKRCYGADRVTLLLYSFEHFTGFNVERGVSPRRVHYMYNDGFEMKGVVQIILHEARNIPCTLQVHDDIRNEDSHIGSLMLTHLLDDEGMPFELRKVILQVSIFDGGGKYREALCANLRDAALSGNRFISVRLICSPPDEADEGEPADLMRRRGYGPCRNVRELHIWPSLVLPNVPDWARHKD